MGNEGVPRAPGTAVLLLAPAGATGESASCVDLMTPAPPAGENVLSVAVAAAAADRIRVWREHAGELPRNAAVVSVGETFRSTDGAETASREWGDVTVTAVADPSDLTELGIAVNERLRAFADAGGRTVVCLHSLSALLQYASVQRTFRFLHVLCGRLATVGAVSHVHMDPTAHDERTVSRFAHLFDATVELDRDGGATVRRA